ncbi:hypothetical protein [Allorhizobium undicola]|uniref:hypothetical protein n=1 Tax=Allorhizobium undicola TaxID=78527 RepID=UPI000483DD87|nr:hypothetical protein [Allorhizobium undicola]
MVDVFSSGRATMIAVAALLLAAVAFAFLPMVKKSTLRDQGHVTEPAEMPGKSGSSTFGGRLAEPRGDVRGAEATPSATQRNAWPGFVPRSSGLYTAPGGN